MKDANLREEKIQNLKKELVEKYIYIMSIVLFSYMLFFIFYLESKFMIMYLAAGIVLLLAPWIIFKNRIPLILFVRIYMIIAPLYNFLIMLLFWNYSVASFAWLLPLPIGAYIFFSRKEVFMYSLYAIITILIVWILANTSLQFQINLPKNGVRISDIFLFLINIIIVALLLFYKDKIRRLQIMSELEKKEKLEFSTPLDKKEIEYYKELFQRIDSLMIEKRVFKDVHFNISTLSIMLKVSNSYISRAIRYQDYTNFNNFLNFYRIDYVIKLIEQTDLDKLTLFYIYTEAGYKSQSTFNRAFKELKGITPSEYIQKLKNDESPPQL